MTQEHELCKGRFVIGRLLVRLFGFHGLYIELQGLSSCALSCQRGALSVSAFSPASHPVSGGVGVVRRRGTLVSTVRKSGLAMTRWDTTVTAEAELVYRPRMRRRPRGNSSCFRRDEGKQTSECVMHMMRKTAKVRQKIRWEKTPGEKSETEHWVRRWHKCKRSLFRSRLEVIPGKETEDRPRDLEFLWGRGYPLWRLRDSAWMEIRKGTHLKWRSMITTPC